MAEKNGPPFHLPATTIYSDGTIEFETTHIGMQPKPGANPKGVGFRIPPTRAGGMGSGITNTEGLRRETRDNIKAIEKSVKNEYITKFQNLPRSTEVELANVRAQHLAPTSTSAQAYQHELNIRNLLIQQKTVELHTQETRANAFYGHSPLNATIGDFLNRAQTLDRVVTPNGPAYSNWVASYKAAYSAKLLTEQIQLLNHQQVHVHNLFYAAQAQEQRAAAEQARIRAEAQALAHAQEKARLASLAEAERLAAEQARIAAEAAARYIAAEQARLEAEAEVQRQAEQLRLENQRLAEEKALRKSMESLNATQGVRPFPVSGAAAASGPVLTIPAGMVVLETATSIAIRTALRSAAIAVLTASAAAFGIASGVVIIAGVAALLYHALRDNKDSYALSVPLSDLTTHLPSDLYAIAGSSSEIELPVVVGSKTSENKTEFVVAATNGTTVPSKVPVRLAAYDPVLNVYKADHPNAPSITWTPITKPGNASTTLPAQEPSVAPYDGTNLTALEGRVDTFPALDLYSFGGFIYVFPIESGIPPQFVVFRDRRNEPGVASGVGEPVSGTWLGSASQGDGAAIPNQIADKLRGRDFSSFRAFREALWRAAANDPELSKQFRANNIEEMKNGRAPFSRKIDRQGGQVKFELNHVRHISKGGEIYDVDNIIVVTPKQHSELHKGDK